MYRVVFEKKLPLRERIRDAPKSQARSKPVVEQKEAETPRGLSVKKELLVKTSDVSQRIVDARQYSSGLFRVRGAWPFDFHPDELIVEQKRVVINYRYFPFGSTTFTIPINKIGFFEVTHSLIFSSLHIRSEEIGSDINATMRWLSHKDAQRVKDIVDGLRLKEADSLEVQQHDIGLLRSTLEALGR